jgi:hypothetical protein
MQNLDSKETQRIEQLQMIDPAQEEAKRKIEQ